MFWRKSEIQKVYEKYGYIKGQRFLTYFFTISYEGAIRVESSENDVAKTMMGYAISNILERHGDSYLKEYSAFQEEQCKNPKLLTELLKEKSRYTDLSILEKPAINWCQKKEPHNDRDASAPLKTEETQTSSPVKTASQIPQPTQVEQNDSHQLGRDESKHISCAYQGREDDCPNDCKRCAIAIKTDGDLALSQNQPEAAIKLYKKAVFVEPKYAEAWVSLGNTYVTKSEYNNALSAYDKALAIDFVYGEAMFGKAKALYHLGLSVESIIIVNDILKLYDDLNTHEFKDALLKNGIQDQMATDLKSVNSDIKEKFMEVLKRNDLSEIYWDSPLMIYSCELFINDMLKYCQKRYASLGLQKVYGELIASAFYGAICGTVYYFNETEGIMDATLFSHLNSLSDLEFIDNTAEKMLDLKKDAEFKNIWDIISPYAAYCSQVFNSLKENLTDDIKLTAMEYAYSLGAVIVARYFSTKRIKEDIVEDKDFKHRDSKEFIFHSVNNDPVTQNDFIKCSVFLNVISNDNYLDGCLVEISNDSSYFLCHNGLFYFSNDEYGRSRLDKVMLQVIPAAGEDLSVWEKIVDNRKPYDGVRDALMFDKLTMWGKLEKTSNIETSTGFVLKDAFLKYSDSRAQSLFPSIPRYEYVFSKKKGKEELALVKYTGVSTCAFIPTEINGFNVTEIEEKAFAYNCSIKEIFIPNTVTHICKYAFLECEQLESVHLGEHTKLKDLDSLGVYRAENNNNYKIIDGVIFSPNMRTLLRFSKKIRGRYYIPEGVECIAEGAFIDAILDDLYFPHTIQRIKNEIFNNIINDTCIKRVHIPSVTTRLYKCEYRLPFSDDVIICAPEKSDAAEFAKEWGFSYEVEN